jgi:hypothetical protein
MLRVQTLRCRNTLRLEDRSQHNAIGQCKALHQIELKDVPP